MDILFVLSYFDSLNENKTQKHMPFITSESVKEKREALKKALPNFKLSVTKRHHSTIDVAIMEGPLELASDRVNINHFYIEECGLSSEWIEVLLTIKKIINSGNRIICEDGDYGSIPSFYIGIEIGKWDKPYVKKGESRKQATPAGERAPQLMEQSAAQ